MLTCSRSGGKQTARKASEHRNQLYPDPKNSPTNGGAFRRRFWKAVANDPELSKQFDDESLLRMKKHGYVPKVPYGDHYINPATFILHHSTPISENGGVYDMDNLKIVTPLDHNTIHYGEKQ
ncbi:hypothetical protein [Pseudomonas sp. Marseille-P8916]|uniref:hypothetical protein n=1 Tax=Pseudomonas sp. Marseille-P8916 TaxID=2866589 RepID=UPI0039A77588